MNESYIRYKDKKENKVVLEYGYTGTRLNQLYLGFPEDVYIQTRPDYLSTNVEDQTMIQRLHLQRMIINITMHMYIQVASFQESIAI